MSNNIRYSAESAQFQHSCPSRTLPLRQPTHGALRRDKFSVLPLVDELHSLISTAEGGGLTERISLNRQGGSLSRVGNLPKVVARCAATSVVGERLGNYAD